MTPERVIILTLLGVWMAREFFFAYQTHKLLAKLMSRDFYTFKQAEQLGKAAPDRPGKVDDDEPDPVIL